MDILGQGSEAATGDTNGDVDEGSSAPTQSGGGNGWGGILSTPDRKKLEERIDRDHEEAARSMREQEETLDAEEYVDGQYCEPGGGQREEGEGRGMGVASRSLHEFVLRAGGAEQALAMIQELLRGAGGLGNTRGGNGESVEPQSGTGETSNEGRQSETGVGDKNETSQR